MQAQLPSTVTAGQADDECCNRIKVLAGNGQTGSMGPLAGNRCVLAAGLWSRLVALEGPSTFSYRCEPFGIENCDAFAANIDVTI